MTALIGALVFTVGALAACTSSNSESAEQPNPDESRSAATENSNFPAQVRSDDFQLRYRLDGISRISGSVGLLPGGPFVLDPSVRWDAVVKAAQRVGQIRVDPEIAQSLSVGNSSVNESRLIELKASEGTVQAPVTGRLLGPAQAARVDAPGLDVVVDLTPIQQLRYQSSVFRGAADIETVIGQRSVPCLAVWVEAGSGLHCRLPGYVETAPGLRAQVTLTSVPIQGAILVPNVYVGYDEADDSYFVVIERDGEADRVAVTVGSTDGVVRVITSELPIGANLRRPGSALP